METSKKNTKQVLTIIITCVIAVALIVVLGLLAAMSGRVAMNPAGTVGNTAGNLNNEGLFCEYNGKVYFSNPQDNGTLYVMNIDETEKTKLNDMRVRNILAGGEYLYYFQLNSEDTSGFGSITNTHALNRCTLQGRKATSLTRDVVVTGQLVDNYLYLLTAGKEHPLFYKLKIDKSDLVNLAAYSINPACVSDGVIYYNNTRDNHSLYALDTRTDAVSLIWNGNLWYPIMYGEYFYYLDVENDYRLCRYSPYVQVVEVLTNDRVDCFNVGSGYIYYQKNSATDPQLICMHTDGSNAMVIAEGNYTNINMTSEYVYFQDFAEKSSLFHSRLGSDWYSGF